MFAIPAAGFFGLGPMEMFIIVGLGILLFGARRLPELGRSLGKGLVEFKKGLKGLEDEVDGSTPVRNDVPAEAPRPPQKIGNPAPKFEDHN
ncbi:MAG: twin-arginine translocase TatA/TatE family subunit [Gemmataceae bacterium]